jgi:3-dehydroquinate synthase
LQYRAGLVESVKHAAIADAEYFAFLEKNIDVVLRRDTRILEKIAGWNCRIKASVVEEDPTEKNKRRILNYGHTIGHAVESACGYQLLHGQCVAIGMIAVGMMERTLGMVNDNRLERIEALLKKLGMPTGISADVKMEQLMDLLLLDKKAVGKRPWFVLLERLGRVYCKDGQWAHEVSREIIGECLGRLAEKTP